MDKAGKAFSPPYTIPDVHQTFNDPPPSYEAASTSSPGPNVGFHAPAPYPSPSFQKSPIPGERPSVAVITPSVMTPINIIAPIGPNSSHMICPFCQSQINTRIKKTPSTLAYISSLLLCGIGCFCGCCLIPCCLEGCKTTEHTCPHCERLLGRYSRS